MARLIRDNFIAVAYPGMAGNGHRVLTPDGKELPGDYYPDQALKKALTAWDELPEAERRPRQLPKLTGYAEPPAPPPGGLILKVHVRALQRDARGELHRPEKVLVSGGYGFAAEP